MMSLRNFEIHSKDQLVIEMAQEFVESRRKMALHESDQNAEVLKTRGILGNEAFGLKER